MTESTGKRKAVAPVVLSFLRDHANLEYPTTDITAEVGLMATSVNGALNRLASDPDSPIVSPRKGVYMYVTGLVKKRDEPKGPMMYEEVGRTKDGVIVVRDELGILRKLGDQL